MRGDLTREASWSAGVLYRFGIGGVARWTQPFLSLAMAVVASVEIAEAPLFAGDPARSFSVIVTVTNLPASAEFLPLSTEVDFTSLLQPLGISDAVDARSI